MASYCFGFTYSVCMHCTCYVAYVMYSFFLRIIICSFFLKVDCNVCVRTSPDFKTVFEHDKLFVDKTLLIYEFLSGPRVISVTAPPGFGKSTIIDMIRRFVGINVDSTGHRVNPNETENYKLFCDVPLHICKNKSFVAEHFGKYPVLHINFSCLKNIYSYQDVLTKLRELLALTCSQYHYLLEDENLWNESMITKERFQDYMSMGKELHEKIITNGFSVLLRLLEAYFELPVIILIDEFNVHVNNLLFKTSLDTDRIDLYFIDFYKGLMDYDVYISRAFLSGNHHTLFVQHNISQTKYESRFLGNDNYSKYYVFNTQEVNSIIKRNVINTKTREYIAAVIDDYYGGYTIEGKNGTVYNIPSIIKFFENKMTPANYWIRIPHIFSDLVINLFTTQVKNMVLLRSYIKCNNSKQLCREAIHELNEYHNLIYEPRVEIKAWIFQFLYDLGYLTPPCPTLTLIPGKKIPLKIPNDEMFMAFCSVLKNYYVVKHNYSLKHVKDLQNAVDLFKPVSNDIDAYITLSNAMKKLFHNLNHYPISGRHLQSIILVFLGDKFPAFSQTITKSNYTKKANRIRELRIRERHRIRECPKVTNILTSTRKTKEMKNDHLNEKLHLIIFNSNRMVVVFETAYCADTMRDGKERINLDTMALLANTKCTSVYENFLINNTRKTIKYVAGVVYVGVGFEVRTRNITLNIRTMITENVLKT